MSLKYSILLVQEDPTLLALSLFIILLISNVENVEALKKQPPLKSLLMHLFHVVIHLITSREMLSTFFTRNHNVGVHAALVAVKMFAFLEGFRTTAAGVSFLRLRGRGR